VVARMLSITGSGIKEMALKLTIGCRKSFFIYSLF
jgi:hypothetical protein